MKELNAMNVVEHIKNSYSRGILPKRSIGFLPNIIGPRVICGDGMVEYIWKATNQAKVCIHYTL